MMRVDQLKDEYPILNDVINLKEVFWFNNEKLNFNDLEFEIEMDEIYEASNRLSRFSNYLKLAFEKENFNGIIESPVKKVDKMKRRLQEIYGNLAGDLLIKCDNLLPIAGSIKARGGIYEVLKHAEDLAFEEGLLKKDDNYEILLEDQFRDFFNQYKISVGSTGNLGLSIGIMGAKLGFEVYVHMSNDAKEWKKNLLRENNVNVIEHKTDYSEAVKKGRQQAKKEKNNYFVDDENSKDLFLGYAVAALRLKEQFDKMSIQINSERNLNVYIPCGVGGGPSGIAYGLKRIFKDDVNIYFAEPTHSPCVLIGLVTKLRSSISVRDLGIDNKTVADGLAVGRASELACKTMEYLIDGVYTIDDKEFYRMLGYLYEEEGIKLEPSAAAGFSGYIRLNEKELIKDSSLNLVWATGGRLVPEDEFNKYIVEYKKVR